MKFLYQLYSIFILFKFLIHLIQKWSTTFDVLFGHLNLHWVSKTLFEIPNSYSFRLIFLFLLVINFILDMSFPFISFVLGFITFESLCNHSPLFSFYLTSVNLIMNFLILQIWLVLLLILLLNHICKCLSFCFSFHNVQVIHQHLIFC